jgi:hypothetical protein
MITYRCFDIVTEDGTPYNSFVVTVPSIELSKPEDRHEHLVAISGALENLIGPVESFSYSEEVMV